ncbi:MAG: D-2-hydroxyacid dehydrogenase [Pedobacter sp.]|nr:MAG: D-2-hydroxyacid dehydrogenase [Pedobacter sp.]
MKILVYTKLDANAQKQLTDGLDKIEKIDFAVNLTETATLKILSEADVVIGNTPVNHWSNAHENVKFWQLDSAGFDQYQELNLTFPIANMGDYYARNCAETIVTGLFSFYRGIHTLINLQGKQKWLGSKIRKELQSIAGKNIIILGAGAIALFAKEMLLGFGCKVKLTARKNPKADIFNREDLLKELAHTDAVINTLPGSADKFANKDFIEAMKHGSVYANVGRGNTTDENALINAIETGKLAGAILDVTEVEPLPIESKLWKMEQVILTQHSGGGDENEISGKVNHFIKNANKYLAGEKIDDIIDLKRGY